MSVFIIWAALCALAAALFVALPLLRASADGSAPQPVVGITAGILVVLLAAVLYPLWSSWPWRAAPADVGESEGIATLLAATDHSPQDVQAWLNLGRGYMRIEQWPLARRSFQHADRLSHGQNAAALSGLAQIIMLENKDGQNAAARALFDRALKIDPNSPPALFYTGVALLEAGALPDARARFSRLRDLGPPAQVVDALDKQIAAIDVEIARLKPDPATAIHLLVKIAAPLLGKVPPQASLFVFVRSPQGGPPLAVKRLPATFPQAVDLSAADSMIPSNRIKAGQHVQVVARVSASGTPTASAGDLFGEIRAVAGTAAKREIAIDRQSPQPVEAATGTDPR